MTFVAGLGQPSISLLRALALRKPGRPPEGFQYRARWSTGRHEQLPQEAICQYMRVLAEPLDEQLLATAHSHSSMMTASGDVVQGLTVSLPCRLSRGAAARGRGTPAS